MEMHSALCILTHHPWLCFMRHVCSYEPNTIAVWKEEEEMR
jgi:hypothetical protein